MAMSNAERQERWLEKNRALHNLRRKNARKEAKKPQKVTAPLPVEVLPASAGPKDEVLARLRGLMTAPVEEPVVEVPVAKPKYYFDDFGNKLTEAQWEQWQAIKAEAKEKGYEKDEWSQ